MIFRLDLFFFFQIDLLDQIDKSIFYSIKFLSESFKIAQLYFSFCHRRQEMEGWAYLTLTDEKIDLLNLWLQQALNYKRSIQSKDQNDGFIWSFHRIDVFNLLMWLTWSKRWICWSINRFFFQSKFKINCDRNWKINIKYN